MLLRAFAKSHTPFSINVTWSDLNVNHTTLYLYYIYYRRLDVQPPIWTIKGHNTTGPNELIDLQPATWYGIRVLACIQGGNGIATEEMKVLTLEGRMSNIEFLLDLNVRTVQETYFFITSNVVPLPFCFKAFWQFNRLVF